MSGVMRRWSSYVGSSKGRAFPGWAGSWVDVGVATRGAENIRRNPKNFGLVSVLFQKVYSKMVALSLPPQK